MEDSDEVGYDFEIVEFTKVWLTSQFSLELLDLICDMVSRESFAKGIERAREVISDVGLFHVSQEEMVVVYGYCGVEKSIVDGFFNKPGFILVFTAFPRLMELVVFSVLIIIMKDSCSGIDSFCKRDYMVVTLQLFGIRPVLCQSFTNLKCAELLATPIIGDCTRVFICIDANAGSFAMVFVQTRQFILIEFASFVGLKTCGLATLSPNGVMAYQNCISKSVVQPARVCHGKGDNVWMKVFTAVKMHEIMLIINDGGNLRASLNRCFTTRGDLDGRVISVEMYTKDLMVCCSDARGLIRASRFMTTSYAGKMLADCWLAFLGC